MNRKGLTFIHVLLFLLVVCGGVFFFYANQPETESGMDANKFAAFQKRFLPEMNKDEDPTEDMTEEELDAYLADLERKSKESEAELNKLLEDLKKQTEALKQQSQELTEKVQTAPASAKPSKSATKKYQGVKVLGKDDLTAEELDALGQATGKSAQELKKIAGSRQRAAAVRESYKTNLTDDALTEMENFTGPKMVIFYADWCPHCRNMKPVFAQLAKEYAGWVTIFAFNVDRAPRAYSKYSPRGVPSMLFFKKNHKKHSQTQGEQPASNLKVHLDAIK